VSEQDIDIIFEAMAREERDSIARAHGQGILDTIAARDKRQDEDPLAKLFRQAYEADKE
jgi:ribosome modulation factor